LTKFNFLEKIYKPFLSVKEMKKLFIALLVILIIVISALYITKSDLQSITKNNIPENPQDNSQNQNAQASEKTIVDENTNNVKKFVITGSHLRFFIDEVENPDIKVKQGDKVRIEFTSTEGFHDWKLDEFAAATEKVNPADGTTSVEFIADKKGKFEYYCSVGRHRENGMKGNLIVE